MSGGVDRPLAGVRVIDAVRGDLAPATRYLAELGARVDRIVGEEHASLRGAAANAGKHCHAFDHEDRQGLALLASADIIVENVAVDVEVLRRDKPALVVVSLSAFGKGNSLSDWQASDAVLHALSGELSRSGIRGHAPLLPPGRLAWECAATQAAFVTLQSYYFALRTGRGDHLDFAALDGAVQALDPGYGIGGSATMGRPARELSRDRPARGIQYPILPCADGHVRICLLAPRQWQGMYRWMGEPAAFADPSFNKVAVRYKSPDLLPALADFFADKTRAELEDGALAHGVPLSGVTTMRETPALPHFVSRRSFREVTIGEKVYSVPNGCIFVDGARMTPDAAPNAPRLLQGKTMQERPFADLRILDLGVIVVGAETGRLFADQGADVVKVESSAFPDGNRQSYLNYGLSVGFAAGHRNKRGLGLDLRAPEGKALFLRLVAEADVVLSNFKPGTMESLGFGPDVLRSANPRIVAVESSAFGDSGPWSGRMGYGPLVRAATGLTEAWCYPDDPTSYSDAITIYPDHVAGRIGAIAAVALLVRRERTGRGGHASVAQAEVMLAHFGPEIAAAHDDAPSIVETAKVLACAGEDEWCVVAQTEADAASINRETSGRPIEEWVSELTPTDTADRLQRIGVAAAPMLRIADLPTFPYFAERGLLRIERHPCLTEPVIAEARQAISEAVDMPFSAPAPLMGEHSDVVLQSWLCVNAADLAGLAERRIVEHASEEEQRIIEQTLRNAA